MFKFLRKSSPEQRFWEWFTRQSSRIFAFEQDQERIFDDLAEELRRIHRSLCFEFGPVREGKREFIVSADGDRAAFPAVQKLINAAPEYAEWEIIPFRPPKNLEQFSEIRYAGVTLSVDDIWFAYEREGELTHIDLFIRNHSPDNDATVGGAAFLLLDLALGEYVVETRVGGIGRHALPSDPAAEGLFPFRELPAVVNLPVH